MKLCGLMVVVLAGCTPGVKTDTQPLPLFPQEKARYEPYVGRDFSVVEAVQLWDVLDESSGQCHAIGRKTNLAINGIEQGTKKADPYFRVMAVGINWQLNFSMIFMPSG